jgi:hypothetical protein
LQRSIIFVESEDIDLDEAEAGADFGDVMDTDYETQIPSDILDEVYASTVQEDAPITNLGAIAASTTGRCKSGATRLSRITSRTSGEMPPAGDSMEVSETAPAAAKKPKAAKTQMTAKEYDEIKALLTLRLKTLEEEDPDGFQGCVWKDLVAWYLKQVSLDFLSASVTIGLISHRYSVRIAVNRYHRNRCQKESDRASDPPYYKA